MRVLQISNTATDLSTQDVPFLSNYNVVAIGANGLVVQGSVDAAFTSPVTLGTIGASLAVAVQLSYQYVRVSTAAPVALIGM